jgi:hypothetical protein
MSLGLTWRGLRKQWHRGVDEMTLPEVLLVPLNLGFVSGVSLS